MAKVVILLEEGFEDSELAVPLERLRKAGHHVDILGASADQELAGKRRKEFVTTDARISARDPARYDGLLVPGGLSPARLRQNPDAVEFIKRFASLGRPIAAICHGPQLLVEARVIEGRELTSVKAVWKELEEAGAHVVDREVAEDGHFITSRGPEDLDPFTNAFLQQLRSTRQQVTAT